jgi:hypothetical protein
MEGVGQDLFPPPGYANATRPSFATTECGAYLQSTFVTTVGTTAQPVPFEAPLSWTQSTAWTPDGSGVVFTCNVPGIYSISVNQTLTLNNVAGTNPLSEYVWIVPSMLYKSVADNNAAPAG